jgi:hypothetical protein
MSLTVKDRGMLLSSIERIFKLADLAKVEAEASMYCNCEKTLQEIKHALADSLAHVKDVIDRR